MGTATVGTSAGAASSWPQGLDSLSSNLASERVVFGRRALAWGLITLASLGVNVGYWTWWLPWSGTGTGWLFWPQTLAMLYQITVLPSFFFYYVLRARRPVEIAPAAGVRVAMVTLCVPRHESLAVIRAQLEALREVRVTHDSWLLDEGGMPEVRAMANEAGVHYFTRAGVERWNQNGPPFQRETKAGNVNAWLDHVAEVGLEYDVFVQLDIDHRPRVDYLERVLGYFRSPEIAWVQPPSVCGNIDNWASRGLAEQDMIFQGPLQMGFYGASGTPFIIGSHTAYRTSAIREIGGFQPTRAEDHLDTVVLAAHGYRGVFLPQVVAVGTGPTEFATYLRQQFAWAYSMIQIFFLHTPKLLRRYGIREAGQFLMCQSWYLLWSLSLATLWAIPTVALLAGHPIARVRLSLFLVYFLPLPLMSTVMWFWSRFLFQPRGLFLSWRGVLLEIARWPVVLWAFVNVVLGIKRPYMITPKGVADQRGGPRLASLYAPYFALTVVPLATVFVYQLHSRMGPLRGYYGLAFLNGVFGAALLVTTLLIELRTSHSRRARLAILAFVGLVLFLVVACAGLSWQPVSRTF
jgi:cellulose synthase (UDP-forming)